MCQMRPSIFTCGTVHFEYKESFFRLSLHCLNIMWNRTYFYSEFRTISQYSIESNVYKMNIILNIHLFELMKIKLGPLNRSGLSWPNSCLGLKSQSTTDLGRGGLTQAIRGIWVRTPSHPKNANQYYSDQTNYGLSVRSSLVWLRLSELIEVGLSSCLKDQNKKTSGPEKSPLKVWYMSSLVQTFIYLTDCELGRSQDSLWCHFCSFWLF